MSVFNEKFFEVLNHEGVVSIVSWGNSEANIRKFDTLISRKIDIRYIKSKISLSNFFNFFVAFCSIL